MVQIVSYSCFLHKVAGYLVKLEDGRGIQMELRANFYGKNMGHYLKKIQN